MDKKQRPATQVVSYGKNLPLPTGTGTVTTITIPKKSDCF